MEHTEESNSVTVTGDNKNPNLGFRSPASYAAADPDQTALEIEEHLKNQLNLKENDEEKVVEVEEGDYEEVVDKNSIGWHHQDGDFINSGESNGHEEQGEEQIYNANANDYNYDYGYDENVVGGGDDGDLEKKDESSSSYDNGVNNTRYQPHQYQYPVRPEAEDCSYYMKTGTCKFGSNCKFNHPLKRRIQFAKEKVKEREDTTDRPGQTECKYYLRTGGCKYGKACRYNHSRAKPPVLPAKTTVFPALDLNFLGLPIRPGERECPYYMRNGSCKYGANCRFNHPDPTAVGGSDPPAFSNGGSAPLQNSSQSSVASWSSPRGLNETPPFMPIMFSPTQGVPSQNPEWNGYQAPIYPPERSIHQPTAYMMSNQATDTNVYSRQMQIAVDEFPERPGQTECSYYMKTGDCKFKSNCKYHHPKNHATKSPPCALSDKGLPLRPGQNICSYYSRYSICKFGPACKFDHPIQPASSTGSADVLHAPFSDSRAKEEARMAESGNGSDTVIQQSL